MYPQPYSIYLLKGDYRFGSSISDVRFFIWAILGTMENRIEITIMGAM